MGELLKTTSGIALNPYYIEDLSISVYSLEELSYCIYQNAYLAGPDLMNIELVEWINDELHLKDLAETLRTLLKENVTLSLFVSEILNANGYLTKGEIKETISTIMEFENKSDAEIGKMRADRLFEKGRVVDAIFEYQNTLTISGTMTDVLLGDVYHNLGTAYAYLFMFSEAEASFREAYIKNHKRSTLRCLLFTTLLSENDKAFDQYCERYFLSEEERESIKQTVTDCMTSREYLSKHTEIEAIAEEESEEKMKKSILQKINEYQAEYETLCRI